jgi:hypothetical protein
VRVKYWEIIARKSQETRLELGLRLSRGFCRANKSSLLTPIATTESFSLRERMKS